MKIQLSDKENHYVKVFVRHDQPSQRGLFPTPIIGQGDHYYIHTLPSTQVLIDIPEGDRVVGESFCRPPDHFRKKTGIKQALKRALQHTTLNKHERTVIWKKILGVKE